LLPEAGLLSVPTPLLMEAEVTSPEQEYVRFEALPVTTEVGEAVSFATGFAWGTPSWWYMLQAEAGPTKL